MWMESTPLLLVTTLVVAAIVILMVRWPRSGTATVYRWRNLLSSATKPRITYRHPIRRTQDASKSGLLQFLPPEVRLLIFEHAIGERLLHLVDTHVGIQRRVCQPYDNKEANDKDANNKDAWYHPCWKKSKRGDALIPLLLVNRHVYSEAIEVLYSKNTFHFLRPIEFLTFMASVPRYHSSLLRSIKLYVNPASTGTDTAYGAIWPILKSLPGLNQLRLLIAPTVMTKEAWKQNEAQFLEPIRTFDKPLKVFDLFLSVFPDWIEPEYQESCHVRPIKEMEQLQGAHLRHYS